jgi:hypothetical protein
MKILIARHKHGDEYFGFSTPEEKKQAFLKMFNLNNDSEYYYGLLDTDEIDRITAQFNELKLTIDTLEATGSLTDTIKVQVSKLKVSKAQHERELRDLNVERDLYLKAKKGDADAAFLLLNLRNGHEYESWSIEDVR